MKLIYETTSEHEELPVGKVMRTRVFVNGNKELEVLNSVCNPEDVQSVTEYRLDNWDEEPQE